MVVWEGEAQKGGFGGGTLAPAPPSMAPPPLATASPPLRWGVVLPCWRTHRRGRRPREARRPRAALVAITRRVWRERRVQLWGACKRAAGRVGSQSRSHSSDWTFQPVYNNARPQ